MNKLVYLAVPYTHPKRSVREFRFKRVTEVSAMLVSQGIANFSPITQSHLQAKHYKLPHTWDFWKRIDTIFLERCDSLFVLTLEGWESSVGVTAEIDIARRLGKPIRYLNPDDYVLLNHIIAEYEQGE